MTTLIKPTIELKAIKYTAYMSEETNCYRATLFVDGEKWGEVGNDGHGGADRFHGVAGKSYNDIDALNARIAATYPELDMTGVGCPGEAMKQDLETVCGELIEDYLVAKDAAKVIKGKVAFFTAPPAEGTRASLYTIPLKSHTAEQIIAYVRKKDPQALILNELSGPELVAAYRKAA